MVKYKSIVFGVFFVLLLSLVSAELNLKITANVNGLSADFNAVTEQGSETGFDGSDLPFISPPSNYIALYSNIPASGNFNGKLVLDSWDQSSNPRTLNLEFISNPDNGGKTLDLTYSGASGNDVILKDYGTDSTRSTLITSKNLTTSGSGVYTTTALAGGLNAKRYFSLSVSGVSNSSSGDTTPPGPVSGLAYYYKSSNNIFWTWFNPSDSDFANAIVYLDGVHVGDTHSGSYNATGLSAGSSHTLRINTVDTSGNVNLVDVIDTVSTNTAGTNGTNNVDVNPNPTAPPSPDVSADTGTLASTGSSGAGGSGGNGLFGLPGDNGIPGDGSTSGNDNPTLNLSNKSGFYILLGIIVILLIIWLIIYIIKREMDKNKKNNSKKHIIKSSKKKKI